MLGSIVAMGTVQWSGGSILVFGITAREDSQRGQWQSVAGSAPKFFCLFVIQFFMQRTNRCYTHQEDVPGGLATSAT